MLAANLAYIGDALLGAATVGSFFAGRRQGRIQAKDETITTLQDLCSALKGKVEFLEDQNREKDVLIEKQNVWIEYLKGMVVGANPQLVPPGTLPDLHGTGRGGSAANLAPGGNG